LLAASSGLVGVEFGKSKQNNYREERRGEEKDQWSGVMRE
jgi:hypothetical protein